MLDRVAVLSDIHGVLPALEAVLDEPEVREAECIVLTGDMTAGPQPAAVLDRLLELGERAHWLRGNADRELVQYRRGELAEIPDPIGSFAADQLTEDHLVLLEGLPTTLTLPITGLGKVLFCHGTPRDDEEKVVVSSPLARWQEVFGEVENDVSMIVCGHTHMPYLRLAGPRTVVNPGSIGMPYGQPGAHWALLGPGVNFRITQHDADDASARIVSACRGYDEIEEWTAHYVHGKATDADAMSVFASHEPY